MFDKFMCFCSGNDGDLKKKAADATAAIEELTAKLKSEEAEKVQLGQDLIGHKSDRAGAESDIEEATMLREKEASEFAAEKADSETNIAAMAKAIPALEKGMGGAALLQMPSGNRLRKIVESYPNVDASDRRDVVAFFQENGDYAPASGQIVGILKAMKDDMEAELKEAIASEEKAVAGFADLKASKEKEIEIATEAIETKTQRSGEIAVSVVQTKDALEDTKDELADVQKFMTQLETECATKEKEWGEKCKVRAEEVSAISEAINILNDDDALDVFKKARPSALVQEQLGFLQKSDGPASKARKAQAILAAAARKANTPQFDLLLYTLNSQLKMSSKGKGKALAQSLDKVIKMIDDMVVILGKDQADDDKSKTFCEDELEKTTDEQKAATEKKAGVEAAIAEATDAVSQLADEIAQLETDIKDLDKAVAQATEQRKEEHEDFGVSTQLNEAAMQLVKKAQQRLQKFYNPTLYKAPPKTEDTMEEKIIKAGTFVQIKAHDEEDSDVAPPEAPEAPGGAYKKSEKSAGVIGLMDMMVREIETDMKDAAYEEKTSQADYGKLMEESQASRAANSKGIVTKAAAKATLEGKLEAEKGMLADTDT